MNINIWPKVKIPEFLVPSYLNTHKLQAEMRTVIIVLHVKSYAKHK
jgi:hypothetical protein